MNLIRFFSTIIVFFSISFLVAQNIPLNNTPSGAIMLTIQNESCLNYNTATTGTFADATHSGQTFNNNGCVSVSNADSVTDPIDVWYKVDVPSFGTFRMYAEGNFEGETSLTAVFFTESEGTYTRFDCASTILELHEFEITGRTAGEIIYIQIISNGELFGGYYTPDFSAFTLDICAYHSETLDFPQTQKPLLSYYSNPVGNRLAVESPYQIQSLTIYDLVGRVLVRQQPQKQKLTLNTYSLLPGVYMLNVATAEGQQTVQLVKK